MFSIANTEEGLILHLQQGRKEMDPVDIVFLQEKIGFSVHLPDNYPSMPCLFREADIQHAIVLPVTLGELLFLWLEHNLKHKNDPWAWKYFSSTKNRQTWLAQYPYLLTRKLCYDA